ncbi:MAG: LTA synthase family protein [Ruminiclostridium sp.]|nr:LTA synthase family protein [Ruminiclostridium sp.]
MRKFTRSPWLTTLLLLAVGLVYTVLSLTLSGQGEISWGGDPVLFFWNALPILLLLFFLWLALGFSWLASLITGSGIFLLAASNYFKVLYRSQPVVWEDLTLLQEAGQMAEEYSVVFTPAMWGFLGAILACSVLLFFLGKGRPGLTGRLFSVTVVGMACLLCVYEIIPNQDRYEALAGEYTGAQAYAATGLTYPFLYSYGEYERVHAAYNAYTAEAILSQYTDGVIPEEKKVNLISIQLEAFVDLSVYDIEGISPAVYDDFHALLKESYSGTLVTDIFAGGTAETEWALITGGNRHDDFASETNSTAWYLKSQGYTANGSHPCNEWFYDRVNVNPNLGLDDYLFTENYYYQFIAEGEKVAYDNVFFPDLQARLDQYFRENEEPLFSFNVTYQGHGPYNLERTYWGSSFCTGDYPEDISNCLNNYFYVVQDTSDRLTGFLDYLEGLEEPVVLLLYGDHKPWLGYDGAFYEALGISLDTSTKEGFLNYYSTWYAVWANPAAKEALGNDFVGQGPDLSPCFLMNEVFELCGWEGSAYMQAQRETAEALPVLHTTGWVKENGVYRPKPSEEGQALADQFQNLSWYDRTHWTGNQ